MSEGGKISDGFDAMRFGGGGVVGCHDLVNMEDMREGGKPTILQNDTRVRTQQRVRAGHGRDFSKEARKDGIFKFAHERTSYIDRVKRQKKTFLLDMDIFACARGKC